MDTKTVNFTPKNIVLNSLSEGTDHKIYTELLYDEYGQMVVQRKSYTYGNDKTTYIKSVQDYVYDAKRNLKKYFPSQSDRDANDVLLYPDTDVYRVKNTKDSRYNILTSTST